MLLLKMDEQSPFYRGVSEIHNSGKKAENLVKQLLGFSRKQLMSPVVIDLNDIVKARYDMDPAGHYSRPDIFKLMVNEQERPPVTIIGNETLKEF